MSLYERISYKEAKIAVIGMGYVGMPLAVAFAKKVVVIGFDVNNLKRLNNINLAMTLQMR